MNDPGETPKSQTELIIEKFLKNLGTHQEFDEKTLSNLRELASSGDLSQFKKIEGAIKAQPGGENENN